MKQKKKKNVYCIVYTFLYVCCCVRNVQPCIDATFLAISMVQCLHKWKRQIFKHNGGRIKTWLLTKYHHIHISITSKLFSLRCQRWTSGALKRKQR